ncbi:hypothetical protein [Photobacterium damselae]|uniref:hypothetical protein n=1 Tax=Photobacterium damselae TaxID=38293 RepID=UPI0010FD9FBD|nr:hypothetical protein [Photobacterium damselae]TLS70675.1 hypothetical protein FD718_05945 [Photobacterium damselae subsp. damselae]
MTTSKTIVLSVEDQTELKKISSIADILCGYLGLLSDKLAKDDSSDPDVESHLNNCLDLSTELMEYAGLAHRLGGVDDK